MPYGYITELNENVERKHVRYNNRYGLAIAADLYYEKGADQKEGLPALIVGAPYGGVKEQGPAVYANELAQRGFVVLTFDQVYMGESAGEPRHVSSPELFAESFSAAVDYLGVKVPFVDRNKIGAIGICDSAGFVLSAASVDTRIKAVATASMYDITDVRGMMNLSQDQLNEMKDDLAEQRWKDFENGQPEYKPSFPETPYPNVDTLPETDPITNEWQRFYAVPRGFHPNARGNFTTTSSLAMLQFKALDYIKEISPRPILFIYGDRAHSRAYSERAYKLANEPKEKYIVKDAEHIDLYDRVDKIPFEKLELFFNDAFKK
ncbi:MAG: alpha/beta hydrolase [Lactobacillus sp.]|uniref:alpha/beta hydrolase n=1 Tax=Limosilactobacillus coleohominis TaxID=181675 RepID=UPI002A91A844|nr:alpha/beta hydrolase [Limosilactobacillus coleohominis]MCI5812906.1 alpha/beta hydrolase [Lactobacillus sp.]MDY5628556.1 alpha/beta hydrolase [Limosilactobacillus coleohominis]